MEVSTTTKEETKEAEIEVTPQMIEAGWWVWSEFDPKYEVPEKLVEDIYRAMVAAQ